MTLWKWLCGVEGDLGGPLALQPILPSPVGTRARAGSGEPCHTHM